jgi:putative ABC transport system permease protein
MAVRAALGASRRVLMRQLLMESALLVVCGTVSGVALAALSLKTLVALSPADIPRLDTAVLDSRVLLLSVFVAAVTTLIVGLAPAAHVSRTSLVSDLKGSATGVVGRGARGRARRVLIASQVAGTLVLLIAAGLCVGSFMRLAGLDLGFDPANVLTFGVTGLDETRYPLPAQRDDAVARLLSRLEQQPQVIAAAAVSQRPFEHGPVGSDSGFLLEGQPDTPEAWSRNPMLNWEAVTPHYFRAMGIRLLRGRTFDETDTENSPHVVIVSEAMAARVWPGKDPLGRRLRANASEGIMNNAPAWDTVVGVVATARYREIESPRLDLYVPFRQTSNDVQHFTLRTRTKPLALAPTVASQIASFDKGLAMSGVTTMEQVVRRTRGPWRFNMLVFGAFGAVALTLAAVGLFALVGYEVNQRTREIGVRMALGAAPGDIVRLMVAQGAGPAAAGIVVGLFAALGLTRLLSGILFGITPTDPVTFAEVVALLVVVVVLASYLPARRAASVDPQVVLREG